MIYLTPRANWLIERAVNEFESTEVTGLAKTELRDHAIILTDIYIPDQEVSSASVDISIEAIEAWVADLARRDETFSDWRCWWHSHPSTGTPTPSGTDEKTLSMLASECGWFLGLVTDRNGAAKHLWLEITEPVRLSAKNLGHELIMPEDPEWETVFESMKANVRKKVYGQSQYPKGGQAKATTPLLPASRSDSLGSSVTTAKVFSIAPGEGADSEQLSFPEWLAQWGQYGNRAVRDMPKRARKALGRVIGSQRLEELLEGNYELVSMSEQGNLRVRRRNDAGIVQEVYHLFHRISEFPDTCRRCTQEYDGVLSTKRGSGRAD